MIMNRYIADFAQVRKFSGYIDKSLLIDAISKGESHILSTAPRRFHKSVNVGML